MKSYSAKDLVVHPGNSADADVVVEVTPQIAGWETIHFQSRRLAAGKTWQMDTGDSELALVVLGGTLGVNSNRGNWPQIGWRRDVFSGLPEALYLPINTTFTVSAITDCEFAVAWAAAASVHPARLITSREVTVELRGGDNASRHINGMIRPGFGCDRLVVVEVYTPSGNWSSYPPHKHDVHRVENGVLVEADLDEVYYYKINPPEGYAFQRIYTGATSPLQVAGMPIDEVVMLHNNDVALIPEGYHPVVSAPGYTTYYLNILAGSAQSLASADDPVHTWVKGTYKAIDPRVPVYPVDEKQIISG